MSSKECPHCEAVLAPHIYNKHVARCETFAPIKEFLERWNNNPRTEPTAAYYETERRTVRAHVTHLRYRGYRVAKTLQSYNDPQKKVGYNSVCEVCGIVNKGDPCTFCQQVANGEDFLSRGRERVMMTIGGGDG